MKLIWVCCCWRSDCSQSRCDRGAIRIILLFSNPAALCCCMLRTVPAVEGLLLAWGCWWLAGLSQVQGPPCNHICYTAAAINICYTAAVCCFGPGINGTSAATMQARGGSASISASHAGAPPLPHPGGLPKIYGAALTRWMLWQRSIIATVQKPPW